MILIVGLGNPGSRYANTRHNAGTDFVHMLCEKYDVELTEKKKYKASIMASMNVNKKNVSRWGIYSVKKNIDKYNFIIKDVIEKPSVKKAPSNKAVIGRYILPKAIFKNLLKQKVGKGGEIHITDAIQSLIKNQQKFIGHNFTGKYLDCGTMDGYIHSSLEIAKI